MLVPIITWNQRKSDRRSREAEYEGGGSEGGGGRVSEQEKWLSLPPRIASSLCLSKSVGAFPTLSFSLFSDYYESLVINEITYLAKQRRCFVFDSFSS